MDILIKPLQIKCGSAELESLKYKKIISKSNIWYIALQENEADNIYVADKSKEKQDKSDGFAGRTLSFLLEDGTIEEVKGPWHSNSDSLFFDTGYDIRNKHHTYGIISEDMSHESWNKTMVNVIYEDDGWVLGSFNRIQDKCQELANQLNKKLYYYSQGNGGASSYFKEPKI